MRNAIKHFIFKWSISYNIRPILLIFVVELRIKFPFTYVETSKIWDVAFQNHSKICYLIKKIAPILNDFWTKNAKKLIKGSKDWD